VALRYGKRLRMAYAGSEAVATDLCEKLAHALPGSVKVEERYVEGRLRYRCIWQGLEEWVSWLEHPDEGQVEKAAGIVAERLHRRGRGHFMVAVGD
jgi:hypothetical protein